ncbi:hypothetical protein E3N88_40965 [Mikania micrantha]|uniref:Reverse transcriptase Ty1/copia-type domain-containing protein n=1 Tax=Mikania micrantha TaxID=192012 RepID=A0A5N6LRG1_9ASTR|nr:hypothetical protein E3N88_40965 [Mikania micrantha]
MAGPSNVEQANSDSPATSDEESEWSSPETTVRERGPILPRIPTDQDGAHDPTIATDEVQDDTPVRGGLRSLNELYEIELMMADNEPTNYSEAKESREWQEAMRTELASIEKNQTWTLTDLPAGNKAVGIKEAQRKPINSYTHTNAKKI